MAFAPTYFKSPQAERRFQAVQKKFAKLPKATLPTVGTGTGGVTQGTGSGRPQMPTLTKSQTRRKAYLTKLAGKYAPTEWTKNY